MHVIRRVRQGDGYPDLYQVGHYEPDGRFNLLYEIDRADAELKVNLLNGGLKPASPQRKFKRHMVARNIG